MTLADTIDAYEKACERAHTIISAMRLAGLTNGRWVVISLEMVGSMKVSVFVEEWYHGGRETDSIVMPVSLFDDSAVQPDVAKFIEELQAEKAAKKISDDEKRAAERRQADLATLANLRAKYPD